MVEGSGDAASASAATGGDDVEAGPVFEMIVLGSGGGPLETDCSG